MGAKRVMTPVIFILAGLVFLTTPSTGGLIDATKAPNAAHEGIKKSLEEQVGAGRGDVMTPQSSLFIIKRGFPQFGHGRIKLSVLFNEPTDPE